MSNFYYHPGKAGGSPFYNSNSKRCLPKSPAERDQMLAEIGAAAIDELFSVIPAEYRIEGDLALPRALAGGAV
jgi:glycine cleavage system pyridoxal-binding protein P